MPIGIASLATVLKKYGYNVELFDTTLYPDTSHNDQKDRILSKQIKSADYACYGVQPKTTDMLDDFKKYVENFKPNLIAVSCVECTYTLSLKLLNQIKGKKIPTIMGGVFATFSPEYILQNNLIDMICIGEGEDAILHAVKNLSQNISLENIPNIWIKNKTGVHPPTSYKLMDLAKLPIPEFNVFAPERIYRSMDGNVYRMIPVEISRGCPYQCTYCSAPAYRNKFNSSGKWLRFKSIDQIIAEIDFYYNNYNVEYFYFISETFLAFPKKERELFYKKYQKYKIPFWFNTRPETVTKDDIKKLEDIGCHRISIGIESGDPEFRKKILKRHYSNEQTLEAIQTIIDSSIQLSVNNMIGFPEETIESIIKTIDFNRKFNADSHTVSVFQPYRGTELFDYCVKKGYWDKNKICENSFSEPVLENQLISKIDIKNLYKNFNLYREMNEESWTQSISSSLLC